MSQSNLTTRSSINANLRMGMLVAIPICLYSLVYVMRVSPAALKDYMIHMYGINMVQFGILSSCVYWSYTPMQLFVGPIIDFHGSRNTILASCLTIAAGTLLIGYSNFFSLTVVGYIFVGIGSSFAFPCVLKVGSETFPEKSTLIAGIATSIGIIGAIIGQTVLYKAVHFYGHVIMSSVGVCISVFLAFVTWNIFDYTKQDSNNFQIGDYLKITIKILFNRTIFINGLIGMCYIIPIITFTSSWAITYFEHVHVLESNIAADASTYMYYGWFFGCLSIDQISKYIRINILMSVGGLLAAMTFIALVYFSFESLFYIKLLLFLTGFFLGVEVLIFTIATYVIDKTYLASAISCTNMLCMMSGFMQPIIGYILDLSWEGVIINEIKIFSQAGFQNALFIIPLFLLLGSYLSLYLPSKPLVDLDE